MNEKMENDKVLMIRYFYCNSFMHKICALKLYDNIRRTRDIQN